MQNPTSTTIREVDADTDVVLTVDPHGAYPVTLDPQPLAVTEEALGLTGLALKVGRARLAGAGEWTFLLGDDGYRLVLA